MNDDVKRSERLDKRAVDLGIASVRWDFLLRLSPRLGTLILQIKHAN
jgi:hypothetical protein